MATADLSVTVATAVELEPGPKTVAWLESLGWTAPVEETTVDLVETTRAPESGVAEAAAAVKGREAGRLMAQQLRETLMSELSSPERVDTLLELCGVKVDALLAPVVVPGVSLELPIPEPVVDTEAEAPSATAES